LKFLVLLLACTHVVQLPPQGRAPNLKIVFGLKQISVPVSTIFCLFLLEISLSVLGCKVPKTCRYLIHNQARQGHGSVPEMTSKTVLHRYFQRTTACKTVCDVISAIDPCPYLLGHESNDDQFSQLYRSTKSGISKKYVEKRA